jgi:hypothetical protein
MPGMWGEGENQRLKCKMQNCGSHSGRILCVDPRLVVAQEFTLRAGGECGFFRVFFIFFDFSSHFPYFVWLKNENTQGRA